VRRAVLLRGERLDAGASAVSESPLDLAGLEAAGADVELLLGAADHRADGLDVGVPTPLRAAVGVRDAVAEARRLGAHVTRRGHGCLLGRSPPRARRDLAGSRVAGQQQEVQPHRATTAVYTPHGPARSPGRLRTRDLRYQHTAPRSVRRASRASTGTAGQAMWGHADSIAAVARVSGQAAEAAGARTPLGRRFGKKAGVAMLKLGLETEEDLLRHYPRRYVERGAFTPLDAGRPGESATYVAEVVQLSKRFSRDRKMQIISVTISDGRASLDLTF